MSLFDPISSPEAPDFLSSSGEDDTTDVTVTSERDGIMTGGVGQLRNLEEELAYVSDVIQNLVMEKVTYKFSILVLVLNVFQSHITV